MDPVTLAVTATAAGNIVSNLLTNASAQLGHFFIVPSKSLSSNIFVEIQDDEETLAILSGDQIAELTKFFNSEIVYSASKALWVALLFSDTSTQTYSKLSEAMSSLIEDQVLNSAEITIDVGIVKYFWDKYSDSVTAFFRMASRGDRFEIDNELIAALQYEPSSISITPDFSATMPSHARRLIELVSDPSRVQKGRELGLQIKKQSAQMTSELTLEHTPDSSTHDFDALFVDREFSTSRGKKTAKDLRFETIPQRLVLTGEPGGGKTTFTSYLVRRLSVGDTTALCPIVVKARKHYHRELLLDAVMDSVIECIQERPSSQTMQDLLASGNCFIIFDGIDEIGELAERRAFVKRIASFAGQYPLVSILVTSRTLGYSQSPLSEKLFERLELAPFDDTHVRDYVTRWTRLKGREDLLEPILIELKSVEDLKNNPLMLSLICTLYRASGHIPKNRRQVYDKCAELLFQQWDASRGIDHLDDMKNYGSPLMRDIASLFASPSIKDGVQERQFLDILRMHFENKHGLFEEPARSRANAFLGYCTGRAWLLTKTSSPDSDGSRYIFTHQTFLEYFLADSIAKASSPNRARLIVEKILSFYEENQSSIMPELILQCANESEESLGAQILLRLRNLGLTNNTDTGRRRLLLLRLRLLAADFAGKVVIEGVIEDILTQLRSGLKEGESEQFFLAIRNLRPEARDRLAMRVREDESGDKTSTSVAIHLNIPLGYVNEIRSATSL